MNIKTIYPALLASLSIVLAACGETDEATSTPPQGALPSAEFTPNDLTAEPFADDAILITATDDDAPFYSLELLADGHYVLTPRSHDFYTAPVGVAADAGGKVSALRGRRSHATRSTTTDENGTVSFDDGSEYGKFEKTGEKKYRLGNGVTVDLMNATNSDKSIVYGRADGTTSRVYVNVSEPAVGEEAKSLCRTWRYDSFEAWVYWNGNYVLHGKQTVIDGKVESFFKGSFGIDGEDMMEDLFGPDEEMPYKVIFSPSKTYIVFYLDGDVQKSKWEWRNKAQGVLHYEDCEENEDYDDEWDGDVTVRFAGNQMRIYEDYSDTEDGIPMRMVAVNTLTATN